MFKSATLKLTGWYLLILITISILFSAVIYTMASGEVNARLVGLQRSLQNDGIYPNMPQSSDVLQIRHNQQHKAEVNLFFSLFYTNLLVVILGGAGSYFLARRTLGPIEEAHAAQASFVSDASHELRTPLAVMRTELEVALKETELSANDVREILGSSLEEVERLGRLSEMLLQLSRFDYQDLSIEPTDLNSIVSQVRKRLDKSGHRIKLAVSATPVLARGNATALDELSMILIDNALKYSPEKSQITVSTAIENNRAIISVSNEGDGINAKDLPHIFDRFFRADISRSSKTTPGFGLGLALAKQIVELHDGELSASSATHSTTTFVCKLPLSADNQHTYS